MNSLKLGTKQDYSHAISTAINGGDVCFTTNYQSILKIKSVKKKHLVLHIYLRALLAIRAGKPDDAENMIEILKKNNGIYTNQANFLRALILFRKGERREAFILLKQCLKESNTRRAAAKLLLLMQTLDKSSAINGIDLNSDLSTMFPHDSRINIDVFTCKMLLGDEINECTNTFRSSPSCLQLGYETANTFNLEWKLTDFASAKEEYSCRCSDALGEIEDKFKIKINHEVLDDRHKFIINANSVLDDRIKRVAIKINKDYSDKLPTKALEMLSKPYCWTLYQDHLIPFILSEIMNIRNLKSPDQIKLHEIGPGTGYLMFILSKIKNIVVTGSDCYDSHSFTTEVSGAHVEDLRNFKSNTAQKLLSYEKLDLYCYYIINKMMDQDKNIRNFPVSSDKFCESLLDSAIVFSHLPSFDMYSSNGERRDAWGSDEWYNFFDNIFNDTRSKVQAIIIAKNHHSTNLEKLKEKTETTPNNSGWSLHVIRGDFCSGLIVIARRIFPIKSSNSINSAINNFSISE